MYGRTPGMTPTAAYAMSAPTSARCAGHEVQQQRAAAAVAGRQEDGDVADFLRDLVRGDGDGRVDAERNRREDRRADDRAVDEVVERVADEDERRGRAVHLALVGVAVPQQHQLLEDEERQDAGEQRAEHGAGGSVSSASGSSASSATPSSAPTA